MIQNKSVLRSVSFRAALLGAFLLPAVAHAAPVTTWAQSTGSNATALNTAGPVLGSGAAGSGSGQQIYATAPATYTLAAVGDSIVFSGAVVFDLSAAAGADQFRFGLYDSNGQSGTTGWLGYFATNSGSGANPNGRLWERDAGNTSGYGSNGTGSATQRAAIGGVPSNTFAAGSYAFSLSATRTETGLALAWRITGTNLTYSISGTYADATSLTYSFDRVGIFTGGGLNANQVTFSNADLTFTAASSVPEPSSFALLAGAACAAFVANRRRRR